MRKLGLTLGLSLGLASVAFAGGPDHMAMPVDNSSGHFYLGLIAGMGLQNSTQALSGDLTTAGGTSVFSVNNEIGTASFLGGLGLGYNAVFSNDVFLGIAGNLLYNSLNHNITDATGTFTPVGGTALTYAGSTNLRNSFQGGADLRLGAKIDNVTPYIFGGFEAGSFKYSTPFASTTKTLWGPSAGLGVLFDIAPQWNAGLEGGYTWFGTIHANNSAVNQVVNGVTVTGSTASSIKVGQARVLASVNYLF